MLRTAALASAALKRLATATASARPSVLSRALSTGPLLSHSADLAPRRSAVSRLFLPALDHPRGYARGHRVPPPSEGDDDEDEEFMDKEDESEWSKFSDDDDIEMDSDADDDFRCDDDSEPEGCDPRRRRY